MNTDPRVCLAWLAAKGRQGEARYHGYNAADLAAFWRRLAVVKGLSPPPPREA